MLKIGFLQNLFHRNKRNLSLSSYGYSPFTVTSGGNVIFSNTIDASTALTNSDIFAIVSRIASNISSMKLKTPNQKITQSLKNPSPYINGFSFWQKTIVQMLLTGNSYVLIHRDGNKQPSGFTQIPANEVQINILSKQAGDDADGIFYTITLDDEGTKHITVSGDDMLHFRCLVSGSDQQTHGFCGVSPLISLAQEADIQDQSNKLAVSSLRHAIAPTYALKIPGAQVADEDKDNLRNNFEASISGTNQGRPIILDQSMDVAPLQVNSNIDKLLSNTQFAQNQIAKAFNIPAEYLNGTGDQQSSIQMMNSLYVNALSIYIHPILSEMTQKLGVEVTADLSSLSDVDHQQLISNIISLSAGKSPVIPPMTAIKLLRNVDAMGLGDLSIDEIYDDFKHSQISPPVNTTKGGETDETEND